MKEDQGNSRHKSLLMLTIKVSLIREFCMYSSILAAQYVQEHISTCLSISTVIFSFTSKSGKDFYIQK